VRHKERRGSLGDLPSLDQLFPKARRDEQEQWRLLEREVSTSVGVVLMYVQRAGISSTYDVGEKSVEIISHYEYWPDRTHQWEFRRFDALMRVLNGAIGVYEHRLAAAKRERWNPLVWIAHVMRWPKYVLEYSGLAHEKDAGEKALTFWKWILPYAVGVLTSPLLHRLYAYIKDSIAISINSK